MAALLLMLLVTSTVVTSAQHIPGEHNMNKLEEQVGDEERGVR